MKTISLQEAGVLLQRASALILPEENGVLVYPSIDMERGIGDNPFFYVTWEIDGLEFRVECFERDNQKVKIDDNFIYLIDEDGAELEIQLLQPVKFTELLKLI